MSFVDAIMQGDIKYEDMPCNVKRTVFIDRLAYGAYILHIYFGHIHYRSLVSEHALFAQMRARSIPFREGWMVYHVRNHVV